MATTTTPKENKQVVRRFVDEVVNKSKYDRIDEFVAEGMIDHTPFGDTRGRDALRETTERLRAAFPDFAVTPDDVVAEGDTVAVRMTQRGTHEGEFMGFEPTNRSFEIDATAFVRVEDGRIVERRVQPDVLGLLRQLGVVQLPE